MTEPSVGEASEADIPAFVDLWVSAERARSAELGTKSRIDPYEVETFVLGRFTEPGRFALALTDASGVAAIAIGIAARERDGSGQRLVPGLAHLSMVAVSPDKWGAGYGTMIVGAVLGTAHARAFDRVQLWTQESNARAHSVYRRVGFGHTGRTKIDDVGELIGHWLASDLGPRPT